MQLCANKIITCTGIGYNMHALNKCKNIWPKNYNRKRHNSLCLKSGKEVEAFIDDYIRTASL